MEDIEKTNADECLNELFEEESSCDCGENCTCGENCECTPENTCNENCSCGEDCDTGDECACKDDPCHDEKCECDDESETASDGEGSENCTCGEEKSEDDEKCKCGCGEPIEEERQPSDTAFDALIRLQAEFDNYRKRTEKEKDEIYHHGFVDAVADFLPALDSFKMAKQYITDKNTLVGIEYIEKGILQTLEKMGVTTIDATGKFDPNFHTAIDTSDDENFESGDIVKECYKGFKMGDKVIRFSQVIVKR